MPRYYNHVVGRTSIDLKTGGSAVISVQFRKDSAFMISRCSLLQKLIQDILFATHGAKVFDASAMARNNQHPNARMEFLCSTEYGQNDPVLSKVFSQSQKIFRDIYGLRNILAHEIWMSCDDYSFKTLFSKIEEEERKLKIAGRIEFDEKSKSIDVYNAIVRYINKIKIVGSDDLKRAIKDIELCE